MSLLSGKHVLGQLCACGETVGEVQGLGDHNFRISIRPVSGRGPLKRDTDAKLERCEVGICRAIIIGIADSKNLARENASLCHSPHICPRGLRYKYSQNDGVAFNKDLFRYKTVQELFHRLVKV